MQLGTIRHEGATRAVRVEGDELVVLGHTDVRDLLTSGGIEQARTSEGNRVGRSEADWAPIVPGPDKIICVGLNYHEHVRETGAELPQSPTYFAKYRGALIGADDDIWLPPSDVSTKVDWEVELCVVIGVAARYVAAADAIDFIAGYTVLNDVSIRDWQRRSRQFLAGKTFEHSTPVGPVLTTVDELGNGGGLRLETRVDGVVKQSSTTDELIFGVADLIADLSKIITLEPGDLIATGTPSGVGSARSPQEWLTDGAEVVTMIEGIGELHNRCVVPQTAMRAE